MVTIGTAQTIQFPNVSFFSYKHLGHVETSSRILSHKCLTKSFVPGTNIFEQCVPYMAAFLVM